MKKELFDGFEVALKPKESTLWEAYFPELPQISEVSEGESFSLAKLNLKWYLYKKECEEKGEAVPVPASRKNFSGHINLRIEPSIHQALSIESTKSRMSLNSIISKKLSDSIKKSACMTFEVEKVDRLNSNQSVILYFLSQNDERIGLMFSVFNLGDELNIHGGYGQGFRGGDEVAKSDEKLKQCFSNHPLKDAAQHFISEQFITNSLRKDVQIFNCTLVSHKTINQITHYQNMLEARTEDTDNFLICIKEHY